MRMMLAIPLLMAAACSVERDAQNDQTTIRYDSQPIENVAADLGNAAEEAVEDVGNVTDRAGRVIDNVDNRVDDIDVDLDIRNNREPGNSN